MAMRAISPTWEPEKKLANAVEANDGYWQVVHLRDQSLANDKNETQVASKRRTRNLMANDARIQ